MSWKEAIHITVSIVLAFVVYEALRARLGAETLHLITEFMCLLLSALFTILCGMRLRKKEWRQALACAALAGLCALMLGVTLSY